MGIIPLVLYKFWVKDDILTGLYIKFKIPRIIWVLAVVCGIMTSIATRGISIIWYNALLILGYTPVNSVGTIYSNVGVLFMEILTTAMLPAMFEELTDRGVVMRGLSGIGDDKMLLVAIAALFALGHQNVLQTGYTFAAGLVFAFFAIKTKSIIPGVIMHFINNFISVISEYAEQNSAAFAKFDNLLNSLINRYLFMAFLLWSGVVVGLVFLLKYVARVCKREEKKENPEPIFITGDELFDGPIKKEEVKEQPHWYEYGFIYGAAVMMIATTMFTFVWGIIR